MTKKRSRIPGSSRETAWAVSHERRLTRVLKKRGKAQSRAMLRLARTMTRRPGQ